MDKLSSLITSLGTLLRDIFLYFIPAIPFILIAVPLLEEMGLFNAAAITSKLHFLSRPVLLETTIVVLVYLVGRTINALSYPLFWFYRITLGKLRIAWLEEFAKANEELKEIDTNEVYARTLKMDKDIYNYLVERNIIISMSEQSLCTASFCIGILFIATLFHGSSSISWFLSLFYAIVAFLVSILFMFMNVATVTELYHATKTLSKMVKDKI